MSYESERLKILEMIDNGLISVDEGVILLKALDQRGNAVPELPDTPEPPAPADLPEPGNERAGVVAFDEGSPSSAQVVLEKAGFFRAGSTQEAPADQQPPAGSVHAPQPESAPQEEQRGPRISPEMTKWKRFWWIPLWVGVAITVVSASLMYAAWNKGGFGFWFACTWFPFALGVLVMALAYASRTSRWLHVRVHQKPGAKPQNISISMPIPLRLTAWFFRTFKNRIPNLGNTGIDELILALDKTNPETPFYVEVNEGANGEQVEVYIG